MANTNNVQANFKAAGLTLGSFTLGPDKASQVKRLKDKVEGLRVPSLLEKTFGNAAELSSTRFKKANSFFMKLIHTIGFGIFNGLAKALHISRDNASLRINNKIVDLSN